MRAVEMYTSAVSALRFGIVFFNSKSESLFSPLLLWSHICPGSPAQGCTAAGCFLSVLFRCYRCSMHHQDPYLSQTYGISIKTRKHFLCGHCPIRCICTFKAHTSAHTQVRATDAIKNFFSQFFLSTRQLAGAGESLSWPERVCHQRVGGDW